MENQYRLIQTYPELVLFSKSLEKEKAIAVDLESDSMYHFKDKVCLIQIASKQSKATAIIDPLIIKDLSPLKSVFSSNKITKVFHGADYDIRSLHRDFNFEISNLFDTQLACRFLGFEETGLEAVIYRFFNVSLDKRFQKKDWSIRPLPDDMIEYAAKDAAYLLPLAQILKKELKEKKRLLWVKEECLILSQVRHSINENNPLFFNFKGAGSFDRKELMVLESILLLRKKIAQTKDKPLFKIFSSGSIIKIVKSKPLSYQVLKKTHALSKAQIEMYGPMIINSIKEALKTNKNLPSYQNKNGSVLKVQEQKRVKILKDWKNKKAFELKIDPSLVLNRNFIAAISIINPRTKKDLEKIKEAKKWQIKEFGKEILSVLKNADQEKLWKKE